MHRITDILNEWDFSWWKKKQITGTFLLGCLIEIIKMVTCPKCSAAEIDLMCCNGNIITSIVKFLRIVKTETV